MVVRKRPRSMTRKENFANVVIHHNLSCLNSCTAYIRCGPLHACAEGNICHCQCCAMSSGSQCNQQMNFFCINHRRKCNCFRLSLSPIGRLLWLVEGVVGNILLSHVHIYFHCDYTFSSSSSSSSSSLCTSRYLPNRLQFDTLPSMQDSPPTARRTTVKSKVFLKPDFSIARFRMVHVDMMILMHVLHRLTMSRSDKTSSAIKRQVKRFSCMLEKIRNAN